MIRSTRLFSSGVDMSHTTNKELELTLERVRELSCQGFDGSHAWGKAWLEHRIANWPSDWGNDLQVLIYGDFEPPKADLDFPKLGIKVHAKKLDNKMIRSARCVLKATVTIDERSVLALLDATRRINILLGSWTLVERGNAGCGWWSRVTHGTGGGVLTVFDHEDLHQAVQGVLCLPDAVRQKVNAALYWVREPHNLLMEHYRSDLLRMYSGYWNAFECLVEAVLIQHPQEKNTKQQKQQLINDFLAKCDGKLTSQDVGKCYREIVNPGFVGKASHALQACFADDEAMGYINECFRSQERRNRLYDIRNAINHGDIDAENLEELLRVESRLQKLRMIVLRMFDQFVQLSPNPSKSGCA